MILVGIPKSSTPFLHSFSENCLDLEWPNTLILVGIPKSSTGGVWISNGIAHYIKQVNPPKFYLQYLVGDPTFHLCRMVQNVKHGSTLPGLPCYSGYYIKTLRADVVAHEESLKSTK